MFSFCLHYWMSMKLVASSVTKTVCVTLPSIDSIAVWIIPAYPLWITIAGRRIIISLPFLLLSSTVHEIREKLFPGGKSEIWNPNLRNFVPAKFEKYKIREIKLTPQGSIFPHWLLQFFECQRRRCRKTWRATGSGKRWEVWGRQKHC